VRRGAGPPPGTPQRDVNPGPGTAPGPNPPGRPPTARGLPPG